MENQQSRKPRGEHIEETAFMRALDEDPAAAMMALADETAQDWKENAPKEAKSLLDAKPDQ